MKHRICTAAACICLLLMMALPAFAAEYGEPDITPQTTMGEIRSNHSILGAGVWTYSKEQNLPGTEDWCNDQTLEKYVSSHVAQDCADGLNLLIRNYNAGVQITYKLYSEQEIAEDSSRNNAEFYYYPASTPDAKYALVLSGNILNRTAELKECISTAYQLHQKGYAVFVMRYRAYPDNDNNGPIEDIARAVKYIIGHARQFGVQTESYALIGYSSGGHLAGLFASDALGYKNYGLPKPGAVILAYPIVQFAEITPIYRVGIDPFVCGRFYYEYSLADLITEDYPPVYFWYGRDDLTLNLLCWPLQGPALSKALTAHGVPYKEVVYDHAAHGIGLGRGTAADGWLDEAAAFWEEQTKLKYADPGFAAAQPGFCNRRHYGIFSVSLHGTSGGHLPDDGPAAVPLGKACRKPGRCRTEGMAASAAGSAEPPDGREAGRDGAAEPCRYGPHQ